MARQIDVAASILDAAASLLVDDGFERLSVGRVAKRAGVPEKAITAEFGGLHEALIVMLNREFTGIYMSIVDHIERDPRGGLLSRIYFYTLAAVYERPLARVLYTSDPRAMNALMRKAHSMGYLPAVGIRADFIEKMQAAGMVRRDADANMVSHMITIFSAGLALTAPHEDLDVIIRGVTDIIARAVDTDATDTTAGKAAFYDWATTL
jgi:AcrR family transcriptional regulator